MAHALLIPFLIEYKFRPQQLQLPFPQVRAIAAQGATTFTVLVPETPINGSKTTLQLQGLPVKITKQTLQVNIQ
jgi:hypothetical protein